MINKNVTIYMYHSVGIPDRNWKLHYQTCPFEMFESHLKALKKFRYYTPNLDELYDHVMGVKALPKRSIVLTFDDGYLDNYVFAYPLLKKYGFKGIIFVNTDFVDPRPIKRKKLFETSDINSLERLGFLSWEEMKEMEVEGVVEIQNHAMSHSYFPVSNKIIDFRHPNDDYYWLTWNDHIEKKPFLQIDDPSLINFGAPVYDYAPSLKSKKFIPDQKVKSHLIDFVKSESDTFFDDKEWREKLLNEVNNFRTKNVLQERFESEDEQEKRFNEEINKNREILEERLKKRINYFAFPNHAANYKSVKIAKTSGYKLIVVAEDMKVEEKRKIKNTFNSKINRIARIVPVFEARDQNKKDSSHSYSNGLWFIFDSMIFNSSTFGRYFLRKIDRAIRILYRLYKKFLRFSEK